MAGLVSNYAGTISCTTQKENTDEKARKGWSLVWEDDFEKSPITGDWSKTPRNKKLQIHRYMSQHEGLYVSQEGNLVLRALENSAGSDSLPFLTGGVNRPAFKAGTINRIEVRARMNTVEDATPYLSLIPADKTNNISIDSWNGTDWMNLFTSRSLLNIPPHRGCPTIHPPVRWWECNPLQYHTYVVETYADSVVFYVDEMRTKKYPRILTQIPGQFPFSDLDFDLFLGVRLNKDTDPAGLPADLFIDWVRYYEPQQPEATANN